MIIAPTGSFKAERELCEEILSGLDCFSLRASLQFLSVMSGLYPVGFVLYNSGSSVPAALSVYFLI